MVGGKTKIIKKSKKVLWAAPIYFFMPNIITTGCYVGHMVTGDMEYVILGHLLTLLYH